MSHSFSWSFHTFSHQSTGEAALDFIRGGAALPDVVLLDVTLPGISGYEVRQFLGGFCGGFSAIWFARCVGALARGGALRVPRPRVLPRRWGCLVRCVRWPLRPVSQSGPSHARPFRRVCVCPEPCCWHASGLCLSVSGLKGFSGTHVAEGRRSTPTKQLTCNPPFIPGQCVPPPGHATENPS